MIAALVTVIVLLPHTVGFGDAVFLAGAAGRLNAVTTHFDWNDRFNIWSGLIGGTFLFLSYFGCDQSQVQRYLTGKSIAQSRLSLLFNAVAKIPMQFFILFIGAMVFVFYLFVQPPVLFQHAELARIERSGRIPAVAAQYNQAFDRRRAGGAGPGAGAPRWRPGGRERGRASTIAARRRRMDGARAQRVETGRADRRRERLQRHQLHLSLVRDALSAGGDRGAGDRGDLRGHHVGQFGRDQFAGDGNRGGYLQAPLPAGASDHHYLMASRWATLFWGVYAVMFAGWAGRLGPLIVAVNVVGSLFYGSLLGCFVLAFAFRRVRGTATFIGMLAGEAAILATFCLPTSPGSGTT